jgi:serine/threonine protein kinase
MRVLNEDAPDLAQIRPDLPASVVNVVHRALARDPQRRYPSAAAMIYELTSILRDAPYPTGSTALAASVREAQRLLAQLGKQPADADEN